MPNSKSSSSKYGREIAGGFSSSFSFDDNNNSNFRDRPYDPWDTMEDVSSNENEKVNNDPFSLDSDFGDGNTTIGIATSKADPWGDQEEEQHDISDEKGTMSKAGQSFSAKLGGGDPWGDISETMDASNERTVVDEITALIGTANPDTEHVKSGKKTVPSSDGILVRDSKKNDIDPWNSDVNGETALPEISDSCFKEPQVAETSMPTTCDVWGDAIPTAGKDDKLDNSTTTTQADYDSDPWGSGSGCSAVKETASKAADNDGWVSSAFSSDNRGGGAGSVGRGYSPSSTSNDGWRGGRGGSSGSGGGYRGRGRSRGRGRGGFDRDRGNSWDRDDSRGGGSESSGGGPDAGRGQGRQYGSTGWTGNRDGRDGMRGSPGNGPGYGQGQSYQRPAPYHLNRGGGGRGGGGRHGDNGHNSGGENGHNSDRSSRRSSWGQEIPFIAQSQPPVSTMDNPAIPSTSSWENYDPTTVSRGVSSGIHPARVSYISEGGSVTTSGPSTSVSPGGSGGGTRGTSSYTWTPSDTRPLFTPHAIQGQSFASVASQALVRPAWTEDVAAGGGAGTAGGFNTWTGESTDGAEAQNKSLTLTSNDAWD